MHISFKIIKFYFTLCCSTCFGHHCVHHQELLIAAHAVSEIKFYDFKTNVPLVGFYSILSLMMHGTMNVKNPKGLSQPSYFSLYLQNATHAQYTKRFYGTESFRTE
jgi:hypothetical protein